MSIHPSHRPVKTLFEQHHTFAVPKYQRGYAWEDEAINDFVDDLSRSFEDRLAGKKARSHFFGGIVAAITRVEALSRNNYEVIDGQQRLASFVMLVAALVHGMKTIIDDLQKKTPLDGDDKKAFDYLREASKELNGIYLVFKENIDMVHVEVPKLTLSQADDAFFRAILAGESMKPERDSHRLLSDAWKRLEVFIKDDVLDAPTPLEKAERVDALLKVLEQDCTVIFMTSESKMEAYRIFQVLNDRGVNLTDGDLLRARTLEVLEDKKLSAIQSDLSQYWDRILAYSPGHIRSFLQ